MAEEKNANGLLDESMSLSEEQAEALRERKVAMRLENEMYIRSHPELRDVTKGFITSVLKHRPEEIMPFAAKYFTTPSNFD